MVHKGLSGTLTQFYFHGLLIHWISVYIFKLYNCHIFPISQLYGYEDPAFGLQMYDDNMTLFGMGVAICVTQYDVR